MIASEEPAEEINSNPTVDQEEYQECLQPAECLGGGGTARRTGRCGMGRRMAIPSHLCGRRTIVVGFQV